ncbi:rhomboid family intramembrane serine protease [Flavobacterium sp. DGU11]|uniref:Rhomboid family intramembrane serine protease n=1 Tax=Flavobacterium arundinis TaxID=3139143 RepID=A0ABU9HT19_9FLAO
MIQMTDTVKQLLIINVIFFIGSYIVGQPALDILALYFPENPKFHFWQPITHMFMHGGIMHIFFNMLALYSFGSMLENMWGGKKFLFFYISCGLGAAALHIVVNYISFYQGLDVLADNGFTKSQVMAVFNNQSSGGLSANADITALTKIAKAYFTPALGASGAIYGTMVAFAFMFPNAELMMMFIPIPVKAKYFVPGLLVFDLVMGLRGEAVLGQGDGIAHFAHIGGAIVGFIMMWYWKKNSFNNKRWN